jgi:hypothetical protein
VKLLVDMNLSPLWVEVLRQGGWEAIHWSQVGDPRAPDETVMDWARATGHVVLTHGLGLGTLLALTRVGGQASSRSEPRMLALNTWALWWRASCANMPPYLRQAR